MNRMGWISIAALELVLGAVLLFLGTVWRYPHSRFGVWVGMQYGAAFWLVIGSSGGAITCSSNAGCPALLVGSLLVGSAVFIYWELARSEQREKLALRV